MGAGELTWIESPAEGVLVFRNAGITVVVNTDTETIEMSDVGDVLLASGPIEVSTGGDIAIPGDTTVWAT
jgi:hypothetical protein